jgi:hypothetical protein
MYVLINHQETTPHALCAWIYPSTSWTSPKSLTSAQLDLAHYKVLNGSKHWPPRQTDTHCFFSLSMLNVQKHSWCIVVLNIIRLLNIAGVHHRTRSSLQFNIAKQARAFIPPFRKKYCDKLQNNIYLKVIKHHLEKCKTYTFIYIQHSLLVH